MFAYCSNNPIILCDPEGACAYCATERDRKNCSNYRRTTYAPPDYVTENSTNHNCYSYAFNLPHAANPGDYSFSSAGDNNRYENTRPYSPREIAELVLRDMSALGMSVRLVDSPADKRDNEYIVALKTSTRSLPAAGNGGYHFAVQLSDGTWADKPGQSPSRWAKMDGTADKWDLMGFENYYDWPTTQYFAVER